MRLDGRLAVSLMMLAIFLFFVGQAPAFQPQARAMPLLVGIPAIVLCLVQIVLELRKQGGAVAKAVLLSAEERPIAVWLLVFFVGIIAFGFTYGAPLLVAAYLYFGARERPIVAIAGGIFCLVIVYFAFERLLMVDLFDGLVTRLVL